MIPKFIIDDIRAKADIVDVIGRYLEIKKVGRNYRSLCPFHDDKNPSFYISPEKQIYHCFGCGKSGDVIKFVQEMEGCSFVEAVVKLGKQVGINVEPYLRTDKEKTTEYKKYVSLYSVANDIYRRCLFSQMGKRAIAYLTGRKIDKETIETFSIGYAPDEWNFLMNELVKKGFKVEDMFRWGLISRSDTGHYYDRFRNRLIFPIYNHRGDLVGFGGRILGEGEPKYLNSPETRYFLKRQILYGFNLAKEEMRRKREAIIVEGYVDVISMHRFGFMNTVGTLGTALSNEHANLLHRYVKRVILFFDNDEAGIKAVLHGAPVLENKGIDVYVARIEGAKDPDEFLRRFGKEALREYLDRKVIHERFFIDLTLHDKGFTTVQEKYEALDSIADWIVRTGLNEKMLRIDMAVKYISKKTSSNEISVKYDLHRLIENKAGDRRLYSTPPKVKEKSLFPLLEDYLLYFMMNDERVYGILKNKLRLDVIREEYTGVFSLLMNNEKEGKGDIGAVLDSGDEKAVTLMSRAQFVDSLIMDREKIIEDCLNELEKRSLSSRLSEIDNELLKGDEETDKVLLKEKFELKRKLEKEKLEKGGD